MKGRDICDALVFLTETDMNPRVMMAVLGYLHKDPVPLQLVANFVTKSSRVEVFNSFAGLSGYNNQDGFILRQLFDEWESLNAKTREVIMGACDVASLEGALHSPQYNYIKAVLGARFDPAKFAEYCTSSNAEAVKTLLPKVNPADGDNYAFRRAAEFGQLGVVKLLLADIRVDPSAADNYAVMHAAYNGHVEMVKLLLADDRVDPSACENWAIRMAALYGHAKVVELLLQDDRVNVTNDSMRMAARYGHVGVVEALLADKRLDPSHNSNWALCTAARYGHVGVVEALLADNRLDLNDNLNWALYTAAHYGHIGVVEALRADNRLDPSNNQTLCISLGAYRDSVVIARRVYCALDSIDLGVESLGYDALETAVRDCKAEDVRRLLQSGRMDPGASSDWALRLAANRGHVEVIKLLLGDPRVNPAALNNYALFDAAQMGHVEVVRLLLADERVDPAAALDLDGLKPEILELLYAHAFVVAGERGEFELAKLLLDKIVNWVE